LAVFVGVLVVALGAGFGIGRLTGSPTPRSGPAAAQPAAGGHTGPGGTAHSDPPGTAPHEHNTDGSNAGAVTSVVLGGLSLSAGDLRLVPQVSTLAAGRPQRLAFTIAGPAGTVTAFDEAHTKKLHLIVVRRDLTGFQHLHPVMAADGTWTVDLTLPSPGSWRMFADFTATGKPPATLGADLTVAGTFQPVPLPEPATTAEAGGFSTSLQGAPRTGVTQPLLFTVTKAGAPVALQPYLGAYGHLVVLREGDLGYVHVHPEEQLAGGAVKFWLAAPSPGRYRAFLDFQVDGAVHTAAYTFQVS
jgi:hypothetical protein